MHRRLHLWSLAFALSAFALEPGDCAAAEPTAPAKPNSLAEPNTLASDEAGLRHFELHVRPLLAEACFKCHGEQKQESGLDLTSRAGLLNGGDSGPVVVAGSPDESLLLRAVRREGDVQMPPNGKLTPEQVAALAEWIRQGMPWPAEADATVNTAARGAAANRLERPWSFEPIQNPQPPAVSDEHWCHAAIDRFVLARLDAAGLRPAAPVDKRTLIRRASYDLLGLPPTPSEVEAFVADSSPDAFAKVVDRLLASPQYGERWGRHWLDVMRYADARDLIQLPASSDFREAWRYRDWVIGALNADLPYDRFLAQQLAGDLLQPSDPEQIDAGAIAATGLLALADFLPGDRDKEKMVADYVGDQIDVLGRGILGLTLACARCHDHKFDPISTADYYALAGIFFSTRLVPSHEGDNTPLVRVPLISRRELERVKKQNDAIQQTIHEKDEEIAAIIDRDYQAGLQRLAATATAGYLAAVVEWSDPRAAADRPSLAEFAQQRKLAEPVLRQWLDYLGANDYRPAEKLSLKEPESAALELWGNSESFAALAINRSAAAAKYADVAVPAKSVLVCPSTNHGVSLVWRSPVTGRVSLAGRVLRSHLGEGASLPLAVDFKTPFARRQLCAGAVEANADQALADLAGGQQLAEIEVNAGDRIELSFPATGRGAALIEFSIRELAGQREWSIAADVLGADAAVANGKTAANRNPLPDASGAAAVWQFCQFAGTDRPASEALRDNPALAGWRTSAQRFLAGGAREASLAAGRAIEEQLSQATPAAETEAAPPTAGPVQKLAAELVSPTGPFRHSDESSLLSGEGQQQIATLRAEIETAKKSTIDVPQAVAVQDGGPVGTVHEGFKDARIFFRGNPHRPGKRVPRGVPQALATDIPPITAGSGRKELVAWLTAPTNPLTARVMVNRLWQHHFGAGLVRTANNFGHLGEPPSHPELLDYLATQFIESGWSLKSLHRQMMLSATYQQSAQASEAAFAADPENRLCGRANRRRLDAEQLRDSLLWLGGNLDPTAGGPAFEDLSTPRRTVYLQAVRTGGRSGEFASLFDRPDPSAIAEARNVSIVAPQALFLLNEEFVARQAQRLADRVLQAAPGASLAERIDQVYRLVLGRDATPAERAIGLELLASGNEAWPRYCQLLLCTNEFLYLE